MNIQDIFLHTLRALDGPRDPQQPRNRTSFAPVEGSSPTADVGTADVSDLPDRDCDGAAYCSHCGARKARWCTCGPIASNE